MADSERQPPMESGLLARLRNHPRVRAIRASRPPYTVVALTSAVIAGTAVALYLDRPVTEVRDPAAAGPNLLPEAWLNVQVEDMPPSEPTVQQAEMLARHPADATVVAPRAAGGEDLVGLPPGSYLVQASCLTAAGPPPGWFQVEVTDPATGAPALAAPIDQPTELACDGELHTLAAELTITGYRAVAVAYLTGSDQPAEPAQVLVAVSFTPVG